MTSSGDIWVATKRKLSLFGNSDLRSLENSVASKFFGGEPVLVTSARAGLHLLFKNFHEKDLISLFPYASQCVVSAAILAGKSVCTPLKHEYREISYNQWGIFQKIDTPDQLFLEDSADSFYPEGGRVCKNGSRFEIWSLPKSLGTSFGAVIWCQRSSDASFLRNLRDERPSQKLLHELIFGILKRKNRSCYSKWEAYEFSHPRLNSSQVRTLAKQVCAWSLKYNKRKELFINNYMIINSVSRYEAEGKLKANFGIIPTVIESEKSNVLGVTRILHKISVDGGVKPIRVFAYQANKRA